MTDLVVGVKGGHVMGTPLKLRWAEVLARGDGLTHGKGGWMHMIAGHYGMMGGGGVVGALLPLAAGMALSAELRKSGQVVVVFFGDGANNQGTFHEALNLASIQRLPVVFVCNNNQYSISMSFSRSTAVPNVADRAAAYAIPGVVVDGIDVLAVHRAGREAVARAHNGDGPPLIEAKTFRWRGHTESDPDEYRDQAEVERHRRRDPIALLRSHITAHGAATGAELDRLDAEITQAIDTEADANLEGPPPTASGLELNVFHNGEGSWK